MYRTIHTGALLAGAIAIASVTPAFANAHAMPHPHAKEKTHKLIHKLAHKPPVKHATFAVTYTGEASKKASISNSGFWLNGVGFDGAATFHRGLGLAANLSVVHAHDSASNTGAGKTTIVFGPRYTRDFPAWTRNAARNPTGSSTGKGKWLKKEDWFKKMPPSQIFAEALFGIAHGFDSQFPEGSTTATNANSAAIQLGVGVDVTLWKHFGARVFEFDYVRTGLPNGAANNQNDLRLSFGVNYVWNSPAQADPKPALAATAVPDADATLPGLMPIPEITTFPVPPASDATSASTHTGNVSAKPTQ